MLRRCGISSLLIAASISGAAQAVTREQATRGAIHPVSNEVAMLAWLRRVPLTRQFPPDFADALRGQAGLFTIEMSTTPRCAPCGDMWTKLVALGRRYGFRVSAIGAQEAMVRSGRLGLPWVGHPVAWVRPIADPDRIVPVAIGTDHAPNLARNVYLAVKMLTGVRPAVGLRAMSKYTGIVGAAASATESERGS